MSGSTYSFFTLDNGGGDLTEVLGINDAGQAVGFFEVVGQANATAFELPVYGAVTGQPAYVYLRGQDTGSGAQTEAEAINNAGAVVGAAASVAGALHGATLTTGTVSTVAGANALLGLNDAGVAVGIGSVGAVVATSLGTAAVGLAVSVASGTHDLAVAAAAATGINDTGLVTGYYTVAGASQGSTVDVGFFGTLTGTSIAGATSLAGPTVTNGSATIAPTSAQILGLNNQGQLVGDFTNSQGTHGFVYDTATGTYTVIDEPGQNSAAADTVVDGINDQGEIVGSYVDGGGTRHGFAGYVPGSFATISNPVGGGTIDLGIGAAGVAVQSSASVTIVDPGVGNASIYANVGNDTINALGNGDSIVGNSGGMTVAASGTGDLVFFGSGGGNATTNGAATVVANTGRETVDMYGGGVLFGGAGTVTATVAGPSGAGATVVGGTGSFSAAFGAGGGVGFAGSGNTTLVGGTGPTTLVGGPGASTIIASALSTVVWGGTGAGVYEAYAPGASTEMVVGQGASTVLTTQGTTVFLVGSAPVQIYDGATTAPGLGNETLVANGSSGAVSFNLDRGNDVVFGGAGTNAVNISDAGGGSDTIVGGTGVNTFTFADGSGGHGSDTIYGFRQGTDHVVLSGFGATEAKTDLAGASFANGNTKLSLTDSTKITFVGVHLTIADFG